MKTLLATTVLTAFMYFPIIEWLHPPFFASWALGVAMCCLARASLPG